MENNKNLYPLQIVSKLLNISDRRLQQLSKQGIIPKSIKGQYDLIGSVQGYIKYLQELSNSQGENNRDLKIEKTRLTKIQADKLFIELNLLNKNAILIDDIRELMDNFILQIKQKILSLPNKLAPIVSNETEIVIIENILKNEIYEILEELTRLKIDN